MATMSRFTLAFLTLFIICNDYIRCTVRESDVKIHVEQKIDIRTQLVKVHSKITLTNTGGESMETFLFGVEPDVFDKVAHVRARDSDSRAPLDVLGVYVEPRTGTKLWEIKFDESVDNISAKVIDIYYVVTRALIPYPAHISENEKQLVKYTGNCYVYTPYEITRVTTYIDTGTSYLEEYTKIKPAMQADKRIIYGPYENVAPFSVGEIVVHYENNSPFTVVTRLERTVEVSHWGNVAVEEEISVVHTGAKLKGPFSRYEYQRGETGSSSVRSWRTVLPTLATDIYYRDPIGNISTSQLYFLENTVEVEIKPRFPLFGGWSTQYKLGYNLQSAGYLFNKGTSYLLKMPIVDKIFENMVIDEAVIKIILPEGSRNFELSTPYDVQHLPDTSHFTYLDIIGRPVISFKKQNLITEHVDELELFYEYPAMYFFLEPSLIILSLLLFFITIVIYVRLDFSLSKNEATESQMRVSGICDRILNLHDSRAHLYKSLEEKLIAFKHDKDLNSFNNTLKTFNNDYKNLSTQITTMMSLLKQEAAEFGERVTELQKLDKQLKDLFSQQQTLYVDKLAPGKISKSSFTESENNIVRKKEDCIEKIEKVIKTLENK